MIRKPALIFYLLSTIALFSTDKCLQKKKKKKKLFVSKCNWYNQFITKMLHRCLECSPLKLKLEGLFIIAPFTSLQLCHSLLCISNTEVSLQTVTWDFQWELEEGNAGCRAHGVSAVVLSPTAWQKSLLLHFLCRIFAQQLEIETLNSAFLHVSVCFD